MPSDQPPAPLSREAYAQLELEAFEDRMLEVEAGALSPRGRVDLANAIRTHDAALRAALAEAEARAARLEAALREVWESVPATHDERDPTVQRHAAALNALRALLAARPTLTTPETNNAR